MEEPLREKEFPNLEGEASGQKTKSSKLEEKEGWIGSEVVKDEYQREKEERK